MTELPITDAKLTKEVISRPIETYHQRIIPEVWWGDSITEAFERNLRIRKEIVRRALERSQSATNNDFILQLECIRDEFKDISIINDKNGDIIIRIPQKILSKIPNPETWSRARRKLNKEGIGLPTNPFVIEMRSKKEKAIRQYFGRKNDQYK